MPRKLFPTAAVLLLILTFIAGCRNKDDDSNKNGNNGNNQPTNEVTFGGKTYELDNAVLIDYGVYDNKREWALAFGSEITFTVENGNLNTSGTGELLLLFLISPDGSRPEIGEYIVDLIDDTVKTIDEGVFYINLNSQHYTMDSEWDVVEGKISITYPSGSRISTIGNLTFEDVDGIESNMDATLKYNGAHLYIDDSEWITESTRKERRSRLLNQLVKSVK